MRWNANQPRWVRNGRTKSLPLHAAQEILSLHRRRRHHDRLQGSGDAEELRDRDRQDRAEPHHRHQELLPTPAGHGDQARALPGAAAVHRSALRSTAMELILLQKVANLGNIGDRVKVKSGYGRNFLLPKGKATLATAENVARFEARRAELERVANEDLHRAQQRAAAIKDFKLNIIAKAGSEGKLFGSVCTAAIGEAATAAGHAVARGEVRLPGGPLRAVGEHTVQLHLHADVEVELPVIIVAEEAG